METCNKDNINVVLPLYVTDFSYCLYPRVCTLNHPVFRHNVLSLNYIAKERCIYWVHTNLYHLYLFCIEITCHVSKKGIWIHIIRNHPFISWKYPVLSIYRSVQTCTSNILVYSCHANCTVSDNDIWPFEVPWGMT